MTFVHALSRCCRCLFTWRFCRCTCSLAALFQLMNELNLRYSSNTHTRGFAEQWDGFFLISAQISVICYWEIVDIFSWGGHSKGFSSWPMFRLSPSRVDLSFRPGLQASVKKTRWSISEFLLPDILTSVWWLVSDLLFSFIQTFLVRLLVRCC